MTSLPDFTKAFDYENGFYLACAPNRISKFIAYYELYRLTMEVPGALVECGVFKGASLALFATMRKLFGGEDSKKIIGFDIFGKFPQAEFEGDKKVRDAFIEEAGDESISFEHMWEVLRHKKCDRNVDLVKGDILKTVPEYVESNPNLRISLLNLDTDLYDPAVTILEHFYPLIVPGGVLILDDYGVFPGETKAADVYFKGRNVKFRKFMHRSSPTYIIKE